VTDYAGYDILPFNERYVPGGIAFVLQYRSVVSVFFVKWVCATLQCGMRACLCVCVCVYVCMYACMYVCMYYVFMYVCVCVYVRMCALR
jgi:hypothetical protein